MDWFDRNQSLFEFFGAIAGVLTVIGAVLYQLYKHVISIGVRRAGEELSTAQKHVDALQIEKAQLKNNLEESKVNHRADIDEYKQNFQLCQQEVRVARQELQVSQQEYQVAQQDLRVAQQDLKVAQQDVQAAKSEQASALQARRESEAQRARCGKEIDVLNKKIAAGSAQIAELSERNTRLETENSELVSKVEGLEAALGDLEGAAEIGQELAQLKERVASALSDDIFARPAAPDLLRKNSRGPKRIISVINYKGGVGKTTLCQNLAAYFADSGKGPGRSVLLLDFDYQRTLSDPLAAMAGGEPNNSVWSMFEGDWPIEAVNAAIKDTPPSIFGNISMKPIQFLTSDFALQQSEEALKMRWALRETDEDLRFRMKRLFNDPQLDLPEIVIIDCPPRQTILTINALAASTHFLTPTRPDSFSTAAIGPIYREIAQLRSVLWPDLQPLGVVGTMTRRTRPSQHEADKLAEAARTATQRWGAAVRRLDATVPLKTDIAEPHDHGFAYFVGYNRSDATSAHAMFGRLGDEIAKELRL